MTWYWTFNLYTEGHEWVEFHVLIPKRQQEVANLEVYTPYMFGEDDQMPPKDHPESTCATFAPGEVMSFCRV